MRQLKAPSLASYFVLDLAQVWALGLIVAQGSAVREAGIEALADLTAQAWMRGIR